MRVACEHVGFGVVVVVVALIHRGHGGVAPEWAGVDGFDDACEFRVTGGIGDVELGFEDELGIACVALAAAAGGDGLLGVGGVKFLAPCADQVGEVFLVFGGVGGAAGILVTLEPDESGDLESLLGVFGVFLGMMAVFSPGRAPSVTEGSAERKTCE